MREPPRFIVDRPGDVGAFLARAGAFLEAHEAENNLIFGIASQLRLDPLLYGTPPRFAVVTEPWPAPGADRVVGAALQAGFNLVLAHGGPTRAVDALVDAFAGEALPGVSGSVAASRRFADGWTARTGQPARLRMRERTLRLATVRPPAPAPGGMRIAAPPDRKLIAAWLVAFAREALGEAFVDPEGAADRWIVRQGRSAYLWEDDGTVVSLTGVGGETPNGIRVGPVYTPPEQRGRGFASNLVARVSQAQLDAGRRFVFLFTDLANPTSNRIYEAIGYEPVLDVDLYRFGD